MYYRRKIDDYLNNWKADPERKPLIVKGARQIGTTESIMHFAEGNYENVVIFSGFMLGINYKKIHSNSVGSKTDYEMYSMDFEELLTCV